MIFQISTQIWYQKTWFWRWNCCLIDVNPVCFDTFFWKWFMGDGEEWQRERPSNWGESENLTVFPLLLPLPAIYKLLMILSRSKFQKFILCVTLFHSLKDLLSKWAERKLRHIEFLSRRSLVWSTGLRNRFCMGTRCLVSSTMLRNRRCTCADFIGSRGTSH